jgi:hypothetical protein
MLYRLPNNFDTVTATSIIAAATNPQMNCYGPGLHPGSGWSVKTPLPISLKGAFALAPRVVQ